MGAGQESPRAGVQGNQSENGTQRCNSEPRSCTTSHDHLQQSKVSCFPVSPRWPQPCALLPASHRSGSQREAGPEQLVLADSILPQRRQG